MSALGGLGWVLEWVEDNLGMRRGARAQIWSHHGTWGLPGRLYERWKSVVRRGGRGWGFWTEWDEKFVDSFHFCCLVHVFILLCNHLLKCISLHKIFGVNFESRDSDHIVVSRAPNNPGRDSLFVSKVLTTALEGPFV